MGGGGVAGKDRGSLVLGPKSWEEGEIQGKATFLPSLEQAHFPYFLRAIPRLLGPEEGAGDWLWAWVPGP